MSLSYLPKRFNAEIVEVTPSVWLQARSAILKIEQANFPPSIRDNLRDMFKYIESPTSIFLVLRIRSYSKFVGYIAADSLGYFADIPGVDSDPHLNDGNTIYVASVAIDRMWQGQGLGTYLQIETLTRAGKRGYERATAHVRAGAFDHAKLKGKAIASFKNWYGTGKEFEYVEFILGR